jgi:hypothetical protein
MEGRRRVTWLRCETRRVDVSVLVTAGGEMNGCRVARLAQSCCLFEWVQRRRR